MILSRCVALWLTIAVFIRISDARIKESKSQSSTIYSDQTSLPVVFGKQNSVRTKVVDKEEAEGIESYYFVPRKKNRQYHHPVLKNRNEIPERTKKRSKIEDSADSKSMKENGRGNGRVKESTKRGKKESKEECPGKKSKKNKKGNAAGKGSKGGKGDTTSKGGMMGKSDRGGKGSGKNSEDGMGGKSGTGGSGGKGSGKGGDSMKNGSKKGCEILTPSFSPSPSYIMPSDVPSFGGRSVQPSSEIVPPTVTNIPTIETLLPSSTGIAPSRSPKNGPVPSPIVAPPSTSAPKQPMPISTDETIAPSLPSSLPTTIVPSFVASTLTPTTQMGSLPTMSPSATDNTDAPSVTASPVASGGDVPATPFNVQYTVGGGSPVTPAHLEEAATVTLDFLETYFTDQFAFSTETILAAFVGSSTDSDAATNSATFEATTTFDETSSFTPSTDDIDTLMQAAFLPPVVDALLAALANLPAGNPLSATTSVAYSSNNRRRRGQRRR